MNNKLWWSYEDDRTACKPLTARQTDSQLQPFRWVYRVFDVLSMMLLMIIDIDWWYWRVYMVLVEIELYGVKKGNKYSSSYRSKHLSDSAVCAVHYLIFLHHNLSCVILIKQADTLSARSYALRFTTLLLRRRRKVLLTH